MSNETKVSVMDMSGMIRKLREVRHFDPRSAETISKTIAMLRAIAYERIRSEGEAVESYQYLCAAIYQAAGAYDMPERILDALSDAANGQIELRRKTDDLLPCNPEANQSGVLTKDQLVALLTVCCEKMDVVNEHLRKINNPPAEKSSAAVSVTDEIVEKACYYYHAAYGKPVYVPVFESMRAALEAVAPLLQSGNAALPAPNAGGGS